MNVLSKMQEYLERNYPQESSDLEIKAEETPVKESVPKEEYDCGCNPERRLPVEELDQSGIYHTYTCSKCGGKFSTDF